jgi:beta-phosphoglucomutase-like phosphatase (HAD superfamily)
MDGVMVDSNPYHLQKWLEYLTERGIAYEKEEMPRLIFGMRNDTLIRHLFGENITNEESRRISEELEARFRRVFKPAPLAGLERLIGECVAAQIPLAVASSAMSKNVEFVVSSLSFGSAFRCLISGDEVTHPKPDPEIYLKVASKLAVNPADCVAFEDSFVGIAAAKNAGMKCVAIASSFPLNDLLAQTGADMAVRDFTELSLGELRKPFAGTA